MQPFLLEVFPDLVDISLLIAVIISSHGGVSQGVSSTAEEGTRSTHIILRAHASCQHASYSMHVIVLCFLQLLPT
jgi:hypothetical protein